MEQKRIRIVFLGALLAVVGVLSLFVLQPFFSAIFLAIVFSIMFNGFYERATRWFRGNRTFGALFATGVVCLAVLVVVIFFGALIFQEAQGLYSKLPSSLPEHGLIDSTLSAVKGKVDKIFPSMSFELMQYIRRVLEWVVQNLDSFFAGLFSGIVSFFIMVLGMFFFFRDGDKITRSLLSLSPLPDQDDQQIFHKVSHAINSIVRGHLIIAVVQGLFTFLGFLFFGVPNPALWGAVAVITSIIPGVGTSLVTVPAIIYLFYSGEIVSMIGLIIWAVVVIGLTDNLLGPLIMKKGGVNIHPFLILVSILGGMTFFGVVGFIAGPVTISILYTLVEVFPKVVRDTERVGS